MAKEKQEKSIENQLWSRDESINKRRYLYFC